MKVHELTQVWNNTIIIINQRWKKNSISGERENYSKSKYIARLSPLLVSHIASWTNNEKLVDIWKYNLYFYSSTAAIVCRRNTVRESSHISFFYGGNPYCEVVRLPEYTHEELTGLLEWPTGLSLRLGDQRVSSFAWAASRSIPSVPKLQTLYCLFKSHAEVWTSSKPYVFFCLWLIIGIYILPFFPVICWSYLRTEISVTLSINYILRHPPFSSLSCEPLCWCYLATALNLLSSSSPAKLVYYS